MPSPVRALCCRVFLLFVVAAPLVACGLDAGLLNSGTLPDGGGANGADTDAPAGGDDVPEGDAKPPASSQGPNDAQPAATPNAVTPSAGNTNVPTVPATPAKVSCPTFPNYTLAWSDLFDGSALDASKWSYEVNCDGGGNDEAQQSQPDDPMSGQKTIDGVNYYDWVEPHLASGTFFKVDVAEILKGQPTVTNTPATPTVIKRKFRLNLPAVVQPDGSGEALDDDLILFSIVLYDPVTMRLVDLSGADITVAPIPPLGTLPPKPPHPNQWARRYKYAFTQGEWFVMTGEAIEVTWTYVLAQLGRAIVQVEAPIIGQAIKTLWSNRNNIQWPWRRRSLFDELTPEAIAEMRRDLRSLQHSISNIQAENLWTRDAPRTVRGQVGRPSMTDLVASMERIRNDLRGDAAAAGGQQLWPEARNMAQEIARLHETEALNAIRNNMPMEDWAAGRRDREARELADWRAAQRDQARREPEEAWRRAEYSSDDSSPRIGSFMDPNSRYYRGGVTTESEASSDSSADGY